MTRIAVALALLALACSAPTPRVVLLGDSITFGQVSGKAAPPYAVLLADSLGESVELYNVACGGLTAAHWLADARPAFCNRKAIVPNLFREFALPLLPADVVVVLLGTNDSIAMGARIEPEEFGRQMTALTTQLIEHGARYVLLLAPPQIRKHQDPNLRLRLYGKQVEEICKTREEIVCGSDLFFLLEADDFDEDDVHPNGSGHAKIAASVEASLRPLIGLEARPEGS